MYAEFKATDSILRFLLTTIRATVLESFSKVVCWRCSSLNRTKNCFFSQVDEGGVQKPPLSFCISTGGQLILICPNMKTSRSAWWGVGCYCANPAPPVWLQIHQHFLFLFSGPFLVGFWHWSGGLEHCWAEQCWQSQKALHFRLQSGWIDVAPSPWPGGPAATIPHTALDVLIYLSVTSLPAARHRFMHSRQLESEQTLEVSKLPCTALALLLDSFVRLSVWRCHRLESLTPTPAWSCQHNHIQT